MVNEDRNQTCYLHVGMDLTQMNSSVVKNSLSRDGVEFALRRVGLASLGVPDSRNV